MSGLEVAGLLVLAAVLTLICMERHYRLSRDRLLLQHRLFEEQIEAQEAQDMRTQQRQRETNREYLRGLRETDREYFRQQAELDDDEPWKRGRS